MKTIWVLIVVAVLGVAGVISGWLVTRQPKTNKPAPIVQNHTGAQTGNPPGTPPPVSEAVTPLNAPEAPLAASVTADQPQPPVSPALKPPRTKKPEPKDPLAREALCLVGADPEAEEYWIGAINDASLAGHERQDLIEDLNEEGFADPKHPTVADLPLILSRIQIIEELAPDAMDKVNADAFSEAYKDLVNMYGKLASR